MPLLFGLCLAMVMASCGSENADDPELLKHTNLVLVDWHISGLGIINSPVAWVRITNYNSVPIEDIVLQYTTYDYDGNKLNEGTYPIEGKVGPGQVHNFAELYLGLVDLNTEKLSVQLQSVGRAHD